MRVRRLGALGAVACTVALMHSADAAPGDYLEIVLKRLDEIAAARAPKLVPPVPVAVRWRAVRLGSIDLGAPLVAFTAADLDGDTKPELFAVTSREVVALALRANRPYEIGRVAFTGERAVPAPRDVVGTAVVEGTELVTGASPWARDLRTTLAGGKLATRAGAPGFLVCPGERWQLAPGRNYFTASGDFLGMRCRRDLVDRAGTPLEIRAQLAITGRLVVDVRKCVPGAACQPVGTYEYPHAGTAFEIVDLDRDGTPEAIVSGFVAPGDPDAVKVIALGGDDKKPVFQKRFNGGVVGIAVLESKAGSMVVVAVRLAGATRVDLWRLN